MSVKAGNKYRTFRGIAEVLHVGNERALLRYVEGGSRPGREYSETLRVIENSGTYTQVHPEPLPKGLTRPSGDEHYFVLTDDAGDRASVAVFPEDDIVQIRAERTTNLTPEVLEFLLKKVRG
jgi:hypothetical protein